MMSCVNRKNKNEPNIPFFKIFSIFIYLFIFGCAGSSLLHGLFFSFGVQACRCGGFFCYSIQALGHAGFSS